MVAQSFPDEQWWVGNSSEASLLSFLIPPKYNKWSDFVPTRVIRPLDPSWDSLWGSPLLQWGYLPCLWCFSPELHNCFQPQEPVPAPSLSLRRSECCLPVILRPFKLGHTQTRVIQKFVHNDQDCQYNCSNHFHFLDFSKRERSICTPNSIPTAWRGSMASPFTPG